MTEERDQQERFFTVHEAVKETGLPRSVIHNAVVQGVIKSKVRMLSSCQTRNVVSEANLHKFAREFRTKPAIKSKCTILNDLSAKPGRTYLKNEDDVRRLEVRRKIEKIYEERELALEIGNIY